MLCALCCLVALLCRNGFVGMEPSLSRPNHFASEFEHRDYHRLGQNEGLLQYRRPSAKPYFHAGLQLHCVLPRELERNSSLLWRGMRARAGPGLQPIAQLGTAVNVCSR